MQTTAQAITQTTQVKTQTTTQTRTHKTQIAILIRAITTKTTTRIEKGDAV